MTLRVLFFDLNSYFASVEQHLRPELRGRPVGVVPVKSANSCCIAASVEAKREGVKTGTGVREARALCPGITLLLSRPAEYVKMHHRIVEAVETCIPVHTVRSIDEGVCRLSSHERDRASAEALALRVKAAIRERIGPTLRCSIGIAPNELLAKTATELQKPDGLVIIERDDLPDVLYGLDLTDLPGIARGVRSRLARVGVHSVREMCALNEREMGEAWGSVVGRRWWHWLRGGEVALPRIRRQSIGHEHVLAPELRNPEGSRAVVFRLLHKAAARARREGYAARELWVGVRVEPPHPDAPSPRWDRIIPLGGGCTDTGTMARALAKAWREQPRWNPRWVGITLLKLIERDATLALFDAERTDEALSAAMDRINAKYGRHAVYYASMYGAHNYRMGGIPFQTIPDLDLPDAVAG